MSSTIGKSVDFTDKAELCPASAPDESQPPVVAQREIPLIVIEQRRSHVGPDLRDLWAHRELLYFLVWRDLKVRYKQTVLGASWAILQPVFMTLVFTLFFGKLAGVGSQVKVPYPLFALAGLVPWTFFANTVTTSGNSLVNNAGLVTKVYFPRMLMPISAVAAGFVDFMLAFAVLVVLMLYYGVTPPPVSLLLLAPLVALTFLFALAIGMWTSALNVKYRDVRFLMPFVMQLWLFISSVIIPSSSLGGRWRLLLTLNPMSGIIEGYRSALFGEPFDVRSIVVSATIIVAVLVYSAYSFRRTEKEFADIV